jgi:hypothetical protein
MATGSRMLTLKLLADIDNFQKNLKNADQDVSGFSTGLTKFGKIAGAAFAAAATAAAVYAGKLAIDGVKAAIEDEAAQAKLAKTLENVTGATNEQIKSVEDYILKTSLAYGVTDDKLRPSLDRLVRSTKDVEEAQRLQTLALNIAAGTGKDLESVSNALAKAHDGQFTALKKLGVSIDESILKSKDFDAVTASLAATFKDQASTQAETFDGKMRRLSVAFNEGKETIGGFILDAITPLVTVIVEKIVPAIEKFIGGIGGTEGLKGAFDDFVSFWKKILVPVFQGVESAFNTIKDAVLRNKDEFKALFDFLKNYVAPFLGGALKIAFETIGTAIGLVVDGIGAFISAIEKAYGWWQKLSSLVKNNPITKFFGASDTGGGASFSNAGYFTASTSSATSLPMFAFPEEAARERGAYQNTTINVTGAIDPESTARQIVNLLNDSYYRGTGGATGFVYA